MFSNYDIQHIVNYINEQIRLLTPAPATFIYSDDIYTETLFNLNASFSDPTYAVTWAEVETYGEDGVAFWAYYNIPLTTSEIKDQLAQKVPQTTMVNGHALSVNVTVTKSDVGLGDVDNTADSAKSFIASQISDFNTASDARITAQKGVNSGLATLDSGGKVPVTQLPASVMEYKGAWDVTTNSPSLSDGTGNLGDVYRASTATTRNLGSGNQTWAVGDLVIYNGSIWQHAPSNTGISSVFGRTGAVTAATNDYNQDQVGDGATYKQYSATEKTKLSGINSGATKNTVYKGTTQRPNPVEYVNTGSVSSGTVVFYLTDDGTSTGNALFPNNIDFIKAEISDAAASYNFAYALTNSNKTLTVTANTVSIVLALLSFNAAANGKAVNILVKGN